MKRHTRIVLARLCLRLGVIATALWLHYLGWLFYRWSLIVAPVSDEARRAVVHWWDRQGALWGYCRRPEPLESEALP